MKYVKKPVLVTAIEWDGGIEKIINGLSVFQNVRYPYLLNGELMIPTNLGLMKAELGDYIIRGVANELYTCKADIFHLTYELLEAK